MSKTTTVLFSKSSRTKCQNPSSFYHDILNKKLISDTCLHCVARKIINHRLFCQYMQDHTIQITIKKDKTEFSSAQ